MAHPRLLCLLRCTVIRMLALYICVRGAIYCSYKIQWMRMAKSSLRPHLPMFMMNITTVKNYNMMCLVFNNLMR